MVRLWRSADGTGATSDMAYQVVQEAIVTWLLPPGQRLGEEQLARLFDVSRTPIREAILRLEAEHLAVRVPRKGLVVGEVTPQQIVDVYLVRGALDGMAAFLAAERATPADVTRLQWIHASFARAAAAQAAGLDELAALAEINLQFHEAIASMSHNVVLLNHVNQIHSLVRRFRATTFSESGRPAASVIEHERIIEAIANHDAGCARELAEQHMAIARQIRIRMLAHRLEPATPRIG
ncbi:MAG: GntR family transcriptional regulator [Vicinamibacterales bacterium]